MIPRALHAALPVVLLIACGDSEDPGTRDTEPDAPRDIGSWDGGADAGTDVPGDVRDADADAADTASDAEPDTEAGDAADGADSDADDVETDAAPLGIGPGGGVFAIAGVTVTIPPGALDRFVPIDIALEPAATPDGVMRDTPIYRFEPAGTRFALPFEVCFQLDGIRPSNMAIFWTDEETGTTFSPIASTDRVRQVCGWANHFSLGFVGGYIDAACDAVDCAPVPGGCADDTANYPALSLCLDGRCFAPGLALDCAALGTTCTAGRCAAPPLCGNGVREVGEECDGSVGPASCTDLGYLVGELACSDACRFDESGCSGDPCAEVSCEDPGPPTCVGEVIVQRDAGTCARGVCSYPETRTDCHATGAVCLGGACVPGPAAGDLVVTEFLANPLGNDSGFEWFEVRNGSDHEIALRGLEVSDDGTDGFVVSAPIVLDAGQSFVFASSEAAADTVGMVWRDAGRFTLANHADEIVLAFRGDEIARVAWDDAAEPPWPVREGVATSLDPDAVDVAAAASWCASRAGEYDAAGNRGTPGLDNPACAGTCGDGLLDPGEDCDEGEAGSDLCTPACAFAFDPCEGITCDSPPGRECDEDVALTYAEVGECDAGRCVYPTSEVDCAAVGSVCASGACVAIRAGDLVITEFLANPDGADDRKEWFEVYNPTPTDIVIDGLVLSDDGTDRLVVGGGYVVRSGDWFVFAEHPDAVPGGVDVDWSDFGGFTLGNDGDEIVLTLHDVELDRVEYRGVTAGWPFAQGAATSLSASRIDAVENDDPAWWCLGGADYGVPPNIGTPGAANASCGECGDGVVGGREECDDGNTTAGDGCGTDCTVDECVVAETCVTPPAATCEGDDAIAYAEVGECMVGACAYGEEARVDCTATEQRCYRGACVDTFVTEGDLVVTEIFADPAGSDEGLEWFEVTNVSGVDIDLDGMHVSDLDLDRFVVSGTLVVAAGARAVIGESPAAAGGAVDYVWPGEFTLANSDDEIVLRIGDVEVDRVAYGAGWTRPTGASMGLDPGATDHVANDSSSAWCTATSTFGPGSERGTPGAVNDACGG